MTDQFSDVSQPDSTSEAPVEESNSIPLEDAVRSEPTEESTIGTGTSMALGCIAGTALIILFGLAFLALSTLR